MIYDILVVDDELDILNVYKAIFNNQKALNKAQEAAGVENASFNLHAASSGEEAVQIYESCLKNNVNIIGGFYDIKMPPGIDGLETMRRVKKLAPNNLSYCVVTAYTDRPREEFLSVLDENADNFEYIHKPFTPDQIRKVAFEMIKFHQRT